MMSDVPYVSKVKIQSDNAVRGTTGPVKTSEVKHGNNYIYLTLSPYDTRYIRYYCEEATLCCYAYH